MPDPEPSSPDSSNILRRYVEVLQESGLLGKIDDTPELVNIASARGACVRAMGRHTSVWSEFVDALRANPDVPSVVKAWLTRHHVSARWFAAWLVEAAQLIVTLPIDEAVPIDRILFDADIVPHPDIAQIAISVEEFSQIAFNWNGEERPPNPTIETQQAFLARMKQAYEQRSQAIGWSGHAVADLHRMETHAEWFARRRFGGETAIQIEAKDPDRLNEDTIQKAIGRFATLVGLPL